MNPIGRMIVCAAAGIAAFLSLPAAAEYPRKPVTLVSPYGAGGNADLAARALALVAEKYLGQPLLVVNKTGAGGITGSSAVIDSRKDGYTMLLSRIGSQVVAPALNPSTPYKWDSFTIVSLLEITPYVCVVSAKSPYKSFADLTKAIKERPGALSYASTSVADASVVFPVMTFQNLGLSADAAIKIPYQGAGATVAAVLGGQVDFTCNGVTPYASGIKAGQLRALVVSSDERLEIAPDAPTAAEIGMPNLEVVAGWSGLYGPPGLPKEVVDKWVSVLSQLKNDQEWKSNVRKRGGVPSIMSPADTRKFVEAQHAAFRKLAVDLGLFK